MKVTIFTRKLSPKERFNSTGGYQYQAQCVLFPGEKLLQRKGKTEEEAIENLKKILRSLLSGYLDLKQVEVDLTQPSGESTNEPEEEGTHLKSDCRHLTRDLNAWSEEFTGGQRQALEELALAIKAALL
jgi:hypothetical protein